MKTGAGKDMTVQTDKRRRGFCAGARDAQRRSKKENHKEEKIMKSNNNAVVPEAREALDKFKMEAASDLGVPTTC